MKSKEIRKFRESYNKYEKDCVFEGYKLAVRFDEKDMVKKHGGRWDADEQIWWMPEKHLLNDAGVGSPSNGTLIRDILNDHQMIMGQYGKYKGPCKGDAIQYSLHPAGSGTRFTVQYWNDSDAVSFSESLYDGTFGNGCPKTEWYTIEKARLRWDELVKEGRIRVEKS